MNNSNYEVIYQNDALHSYMVFKLRASDKFIEYQIKIIKENPAHNILPLHKKQFDDEVFIYYDITSKISMEQFLARKKLTRHEFLTIIKSLIMNMQKGKQYLLHGGKYIFDTKYIYINPLSLEVSLAYMPVQMAADVKEDLRAFLIDLLIYKVAFTHHDEGSFVYRLLNLLKSEMFSLEQLDKLVFGIAIECEALKESDMDGIPDNVIEVIRGKRSVSGKPAQDMEGKRNVIYASSPKKLYIIMLIQLLFAATALLLLRIIIKQSNSLDLYNVIGAMLLIGAADFLVINKLGLLKKHTSEDHKNRDREPDKIGTNNSDKKRSRNNSTQGARQTEINKKIPSAFVDMDTSVMIDPEACAYLISCQDNIYEKIVISKDTFVIGRIKNQADYISQNNAVGKVHAEIINKEGVHYIKDLNSRNGTYINGERIVSNVEYAIKNNDRIAFANCEYKFVWAGGAN